jgi:hypothetical protein
MVDDKDKLKDAAQKESPKQSAEDKRREVKVTEIGASSWTCCTTCCLASPSAEPVTTIGNPQLSESNGITEIVRQRYC